MIQGQWLILNAVSLVLMGCASPTHPFPRITNGNLNAPSIMTGEKVADHILGRQPLARANDVPFAHPDWETSQR